MKYIFLDTNIFLHFQDFQTIDWLKECSDTECTLIIAPIVMDELDEKKIGTNKISNRARQVLNQFEKFIDEKIISEDIYFEIQLDKPLSIVYEENNLNFNEQDHRLIASMIDFRQKRNISNILICSNDIGPRLRARQFGFESLKLSEKYLIPVEDSEEEKKIKQLEQENRKLKNQIPDLSLKFDNSQEFVKFRPKEFEYKDFERFKAEFLSRIREEHPYIEHPDLYKNPIESITSLTTDQINLYNKELDKFYDEYEKALLLVFEQEINNCLTFEINLILINSGTVPAEDIDIHLHFPDGFELVESGDIQDTIELPEPPYRQKNKFDFGYLHLGNSSGFLPNINFDNINLNKPTIRKTQSYDVDYYRKQLKHGYTENLEAISIIFESFASIKNFKFNYKISARNIPNIIAGNLNVIFEK